MFCGSRKFLFSYMDAGALHLRFVMRFRDQANYTEIFSVRKLIFIIIELLRIG